MARVKNAVNSLKKRRTVLERAQGYRGQRSRLFLKHDGNSILDREGKPVGATDEDRLVAQMHERTLAHGAREDVE